MYRCKNCYHGVDEENLNSIFQCPVCGVEREMFEKIKEDDPYKGVIISEDNKAITRIKEKCINCGRCSYICHNVVGIKYEYEKIKHPICINCGACSLNCPMGAIIPKYSYQKVLNELIDPNKIVIVSTSPAVRVSLGEEFGMEYGSFVEGKMVTALKLLGFDYVLDTTFGADLTAMEEATELLKRLQTKEKLPQFSSCCPAWVKYLEIYHPKKINHLSTCKSPIGMQGTIVKTFFAKERKLDPKKIVHVALTPCTAKKYEINRQELSSSFKYNNINDIKDTDYVITTSELAIMLREKNIDFLSLTDTNFDSLLDKGSGAGLLFGKSEGVTSSVLRTLSYLITNQDPKELSFNFKKVAGFDNVKETNVTFGEYKITTAVVQGTSDADKILNNLDQYKKYSFIEVMNCQGGCVGGGGQPLVAINKQSLAIEARMKSLEKSDKKDSIRCPYQNPDIQKIYLEFLDKPNSNLSKELLHTNYKNKHYLLEKDD